MAEVVNRTTKEHRTSVHTPDFPVAQWIHGPDLSAVAGFPNKYWIITGDLITLMDQAARDAVDAAEAAQFLLNIRAAGKEAIADQQDVNILIKAAFSVMVDEFNNRADLYNDLKTAITSGSNFAQVVANINALPDAPQRTLAQLKTAAENAIDAGSAD